MTRSRASASPNRESPETNLLRSLLRRLDRLAAPIYTFDEVSRWPDGAHDLFAEVGIFREIGPSYSVSCDGCADSHLLEVDVRDYPTGVIGVANCPECGRVSVPTDRLRQWAVSVEGLARAIDSGTGAKGGIETITPDRLFALGAVSEGRNRRDVFFGRGMAWNDADGLVRSSARLRAASKPVLLVPAIHPQTAAFAEMGMSVIALSDIAHVHKRRVTFDRKAVLSQSPPHAGGSAATPPTTLGVGDVDMAVLQVLAERPRDARFIDDIVAASGFSKTPVKDAIKRLKDAKLIGRPLGTERQGISITEAGLRIVHDASRK